MIVCRTPPVQLQGALLLAQPQRLDLLLIQLELLIPVADVHMGAVAPGTCQLLLCVVQHVSGVHLWAA